VIRLLGEDLKYVSRGGLKLERALEHWHIDVTGKVCLDVGASTGGLYGLSAAAWRDSCNRDRHRLRADGFQTAPGFPVRLLEKVNARYVTGKSSARWSTSS